MESGITLLEVEQLIGEQLIDGKIIILTQLMVICKQDGYLNNSIMGTENMYFDPVSGEKVKGWRKYRWEMVLPFIFGALKGSQNLDGEKYYFDPVNCDMQTGWVSIQEASGTKRYYYDPESGKQLSGWQEIDGKKYYFWPVWGIQWSYKWFRWKRLLF